MRPAPDPATEPALRRHVDLLAGIVGPRNAHRHPGPLEAAATYIERTFADHGPTAAVHPFRTSTGHAVRNIVAEVKGHADPGRVWIVGAHYDSITTSPAADDNASGVAGVLEVSRLLRDIRPRETLRFVCFVNEEPPYYKTDDMGSLVYARACKTLNENIAGMVNLEMIGCFCDERGSQSYPPPLDRGPARRLLPQKGNFIAFVGNVASFWLTRRCRKLFKRTVDFPAWWLPAPAVFTAAGMSDHWSFWEQGYPAVMVTDTAFFRYRHYHEPTDTPDRLNYPRMAEVVTGLAGVMRGLVETA